MPIHVLFVEDEDDLRTIVAEGLAAQGFAVTTANNGVEAIAFLRGNAQFAIVVTDYSMPEGASGLDVAREAAVTQPHARIMIVSGLQRAQLPPIPDTVRFLPKPYRFGQLVTAIHEQTDLQRASN